MSSDGTEGAGSSLWSSLADLVVYAPIGLTLDAQDLAPDLARRGRQHTAAARRIGEFAVKAGMRRLDEIVTALDPARSQSMPADPTTEPVSEPEALVTEPGVRTPDPAASDDPVALHDDEAPDREGQPTLAEASPPEDAVELAIPDYDLLAASQVVKRLDGLDPVQLDEIRRHEEAGRGRRTILHKITRLQAG
jgi:hypothetical protein